MKGVVDASDGEAGARPDESEPAAFRTQQLTITLAFLRERSAVYRPLLDGVELSAGNAREVLGLLPAMTPTTWDGSRASMRTGR